MALTASFARVGLFSGQSTDIPDIQIPIELTLANPAKDTASISPVLGLIAASSGASLPKATNSFKISFDPKSSPAFKISPLQVPS